MPVISLNQTTFKIWMQKKKELGYTQKTHSAFAHFLVTHLTAGESESEPETDSSNSQQSGTDEEIIVADVIESDDEQQTVDVTGGLEPEHDDGDALLQQDTENV
ncbi:uncharacterized protein [Clytia hemisphaerica]|uniref:Uncharacterized protein n=1 Tax=Clytia hemisphaerica TaxID=252671 RepID=A0A7M5XGT3_9CNID